MYIDQTRYDAFWANPERYRIIYECDKVTAALPYGLARGTAFHEIADGVRRGKSDVEITAALARRGITGKPVETAWAMWAEIERVYGSDPALCRMETEVEFCHRIPGSPHAMVGRIDEILTYNGKLLCGEYKTASVRARYENVRREWETKTQAAFELIGAQSVGYDVQGVLVRVVVETTPIVIWPFEVTRSAHQLQTVMLAVHQTCELIEFYRRTFGVDMPWPHITNCWPCMYPDRCEHSTLCCRHSSAWTAEDLQGFAEREEHLELMKKANS